MIARMNARYKNHSTFLQAVARLRARFPQLEVLLIGDGPLSPDLKNEAQQLGIVDQVHFLGDRRDIPELLAAIDVSVVPGSSESLSNVILESMAAGVPVVATRVGGNPELLEGRGILVSPGDDRALAEALDRLLRDPALRGDLAIKARQFAAQNFTTETMALRHQHLYHELLESKNWRQKTVSAWGASGRLRVALVAPSLKYVGGQAVQADLLLRHWQGDPQIDARFVAVDPPFPRGLRWVGRIPVLRTIVREPLYIAKLWHDLRDIDIAHVFSASYWSFLLAPAPALFVACRRRKKVIINYRSGEARDHLKRFRSALPILQRADRLVVPSGYLVAVFREFGLKAQIVPNIVDLSQFKYRARSSLRPWLVCTRGFGPHYCIDVVVRAFGRVQQEFPEARLNLVGGGPLEDQVRELVRELNLRHVNFAGVLSRQGIGRAYDEADIFINASRLDNMPVSVLEAFASGTPVVTTAPESMAYLVEHERTGLLSEPGDVEALAANVIRVLREPELASRLAANAYQESRRYHWAAVRGQWLEVYQSLGAGQTHPAEGHTL
jgi:glycosyltransferase involved in cell wall biosynthesis